MESAPAAALEVVEADLLFELLGAFLENHVKDLVSVDLFVVPTLTFKVRFVFDVLAHPRRRIVHFNVTDHSTAQWTAQQNLP